jgi:hypothetical protein
MTSSFSRLSFFSFALALLLGVTLGASPAFAANDCEVIPLDSNSNATPNTKFLVQGNCATIGMDVAATEIDLRKANWSCPGVSSDMMHVLYQQGDRECVYIDNHSFEDGQKYAFFVPMCSYAEWNSFKTNLPGGVRLRYGCAAQIYHDACGRSYPLPDMPASDHPGDAITFPTANGGTVAFMCPRTYTNASGQPYDLNTVGGCGIWKPVGTFDDCVAASELSFDGKACTKEPRPTQFTIVLDASGSMQDLIDSARSSLQHLTATYLEPRPDIPLTITAIGGRHYAPQYADTKLSGCFYGRVTDTGPAKEDVIDAAVSQIQAIDNTPLATAVNYSSAILNYPDKRKVMLVLSDGLETCLGDPVQAVERARSQNNVEVFGIRYGGADDEDADTFFKAMNASARATSQSQIENEMKKVIKDVVQTSCAPILQVYSQGTIGKAPPLYTLKSGDKTAILHGTYDMVVDYCTGKQKFLAEDVSASRTFNFDRCPK